jgi:5-methyltetrahydrofolate--homocysteine methyltransferase
MRLDSPLLDRLAKGVMVFDGATGTQYQAAGLSDDAFTLDPGGDYPDAVRQAAQRLGGKVLEGCNEILCFTRPELVRQVHEAYFAAGSDMVETNTFGASGIVLAEYEIAELDYAVGFAAGKLALEAAANFSTTEHPRFAIGAVGPGTKILSLGQTTWDEIETTYRNVYRGLLESGVHGLLLETLQDLLMAKAALRGARRAMDDTGREVPMIVQVTMEQTGTMLVGTEMAAALNTIEAFPWVHAVGMNCATGPVEMAEHVRFLGQNSTRPISIQPNAGLPMMEGGQAVYKLTPEELLAHQTRFVEENGVAIVGGCCGTTPAHIRLLAEHLGGRPHGQNAHWQKVRPVFSGFDFALTTPERQDAVRLQGCSSLYQFVPYKQDTSFLIVGEKTNANGSKAFREMLGVENWDGLVELARELEAEGSHMIDVCTAYVGRDEARDMIALLSRYNREVTVPIMVDSTETRVIEVALKHLGGKPLVNSINFEDGEARTRAVLGLCRDYGAGVVALTIDEDGMAKSAEKKVAVGERLLAFTREYGLPDADVFLDCLTFTLGSGDEEFRQAGVETIEAIRELKRRHPRVNFTLGISNISFGLKPAARQVLNSVFLQMCLEAGLTSAIVHFSKIKPQTQIEPEIWRIAEDLVMDRRQFATV